MSSTHPAATGEGGRNHDVGTLLSIAGRLSLHRLGAKLTAYGLTPAQLSVLTVLWQEEGRSTIAVAHRAQSDQPTMTGVIDRLEQLQGVLANLA